MVCRWHQFPSSQLVFKINNVFTTRKTSSVPTFQVTRAFRNRALGWLPGIIDSLGVLLPCRNSVRAMCWLLLSYENFKLASDPGGVYSSKELPSRCERRAEEEPFLLSAIASGGVCVGEVACLETSSGNAYGLDEKWHFSWLELLQPPRDLSICLSDRGVKE